MESLRKHNFILGSKSPRRLELLKNFGFSVSVKPIEVDESSDHKTNPEKYVTEISQKKLARLISECSENGILICADTVISYNEEIMGKPTNEENSKCTLKKLNGNWHQVFTGVSFAVQENNEIKKQVSICEMTQVKFAQNNEGILDWYISTGEPKDKAGSYGIQGLGAILIEKIDGDYYNVVGLPVHKLVHHLLNQVQ